MTLSLGGKEISPTYPRLCSPLCHTYFRGDISSNPKDIVIFPKRKRMGHISFKLMLLGIIVADGWFSCFISYAAKDPEETFQSNFLGEKCALTITQRERDSIHKCNRTQHRPVYRTCMWPIVVWLRMHMKATCFPWNFPFSIWTAERAAYYVVRCW